MSIDAAIIGIDGSGKSTCFRKTLALLAETTTVIGIGEGVYVGRGRTGVSELRGARWTGAKDFFRRGAKRSHNPIVYEITKLAELACWSRIHRELRAHYKPGVMLSDGAPLVNIAGWGVRYHPRFFNRSQCFKAISYLSGRRRLPLKEALFYVRHMPEVLLLNWTGIAQFAVPHTIFFLRVSPGTAVDRIKKRGEDLQEHETVDFLGRLQDAYELVLDIFKNELSSQLYTICVDDLSPDQASAEVSRLLLSTTEDRTGSGTKEN